MCDASDVIGGQALLMTVVFPGLGLRFEKVQTATVAAHPYPTLRVFMYRNCVGNAEGCRVDLVMNEGR